MSIDALKKELSSLDVNQQRQITAFLVSLQDSRIQAYQQKLTDKIDRPASQFATLDELDHRLGLDENGHRP